MTVGVHDVKEADNVGVAHFFQEGDFADCGARHALIFGLESNLLEGNYATAVLKISRLVNNTIGTCKGPVVSRDG